MKQPIRLIAVCDEEGGHYLLPHKSTKRRPPIRIYDDGGIMDDIVHASSIRQGVVFGRQRLDANRLSEVRNLALQSSK